MKDFFKKVKFSSLVCDLAYLFLGIALIIWTDTAKTTLFVLLGCGVLLKGIVSVIDYFLYGYEPFGFFTGVISIAIGTAIICSSHSLSQSGLIAFVFGLGFIIASLFKIQASFDYRRLGAENWYIETIFGVITLICGVIVLCNPFASEKILFVVLGSFIVLDAIMQIVNLFVVATRARRVKRTIKDFFKKEDVIDGECEKISEEKVDDEK